MTQCPPQLRDQLLDAIMRLDAFVIACWQGEADASEVDAARAQGALQAACIILTALDRVVVNE